MLVSRDFIRKLTPEPLLQLRRFFLKAKASKSYAQCGEDIICHYVFQSLGISRGTFADIGAHHPTYLNNTHLLSKKGWSGFNIDPQLGNSKLFPLLRPRDRNLVAGIGAVSEKRPFFVLDSDTLSTFDAGAKDRYVAQGHKVVKTIDVEMLTVKDLVEKHGMPRDLHLLTLDVEGYEPVILKQFFAEKLYPWVIVMETIQYSKTLGGGKKNQSEIDLVLNAGYKIFADTWINTIFIRSDLLK